MKKICLIGLFVISILSASTFGVEQEGLISIIPLPEKIEKTGGTFALTSKTLLVASVPQAKIVDQYLGTATGYHFRISKEGDDNCITLIQDDQLARELGVEGYKLSVTLKGVTIQAAGEAGVFYGLQTLRQLLPAEIYQKKQVEGVAWTIPCVEITDSPRFEWRGMMLDVARHYQPVDFIHKYIDLMAIHKLNRFHLHLTDHNAWRVEIKKYPELTAKGSGGKFYSQKELRDIVLYAAKQHIVVIPEIESPGHSGAALRVHPEWRTGHAVNLQETTIAAFHTIFKEVMEIFPSEYIHVGGDEVWASWLNNEADLQVIDKQGLSKNNLAIQEWLQGRLIEPILAARRRPAMWFMKESWDIGESPLSKDTLILGWFGRAESMKAVEAGYDVVMAPMDGTYFDYRTQRDSPVSGIGINTLDNVYNYDPLPAKLANDKTTKRILGVQGQLWSESMPDPNTVESRSFPRTCALAEVAWTPRSQKNYEQFTKRMDKQYQRLEVLGVNYYKLKTPMTVVATESFTVKRGEKQSFEWPLSSYLNKGAGEYEMMFHVPVWYQSIEASHVQLICNGKVLVAPDWVGDTTKRGGKINGLFRIKLPHYDPTASYVLKAEVKNLSRRGDCAFEFCLRKKTR